MTTRPIEEGHGFFGLDFSFLTDAIGKLGKGIRFVFGSARVLGMALVGGAALLLLIQSMLYVRSGWGIGDFVAWTDESESGPF